MNILLKVSLIILSLPFLIIFLPFALGTLFLFLTKKSNTLQPKLKYAIYSILPIVMLLVTPGWMNAFSSQDYNNYEPSIVSTESINEDLSTTGNQVEDSIISNQIIEDPMTVTTLETVVPTVLETIEITPTPTPIPTATPTPLITQKFVPTPYPTPKPTVKSTSKYVCNCKKTCPNLSCEEAQFQLKICGCKARDGDDDGIACDKNCQ